MLNPDLFAIFDIAPPGEAWVICEHQCSQKAWSFACEASYQNTLFQEGSCWQDDILSVVEIGSLCVVTLGDKEGRIYQESIDLDTW